MRCKVDITLFPHLKVLDVPISRFESHRYVVQNGDDEIYEGVQEYIGSIPLMMHLEKLKFGGFVPECLLAGFLKLKTLNL